jgi:protein-disulfide isomerase
MKQTIIAVLLIVAIIGGAVAFSKDKVTEGIPSNNFYGQENSAVTLVEYGDFECTACASFYPIFSQIKEIFKDEVKFEYRHFPLVQIHPNSIAAHRAAEAAAKQGKFWEMHNILFERQVSWSAAGGSGNNIPGNSPTPIFEGYAQELGLDLEKFKVDVKSSETLDTINADTALGKKAGVSATPTFILNGKKIENTTQIDTVEEFSTLIQQAIDSQKQGS